MELIKIKDNINEFDFTLTDEEMNEISTLEKRKTVL